TQNQAFTYTVAANDSNPTDVLLFSIGTINCSLQNPWTIATTSNLSTNATGLINTTLTNAMVACPTVQINVSDYAGGVQRSTTSTIVAFNLTNVNDAPTIDTMSYVSSNYLSEHNISNLTAAVGQPFTYTVNGSDPDQYVQGSGESITYSDNTA